MTHNVIHRPVPGYIDVYAGVDGSIVQSGRGELKQKPHPTKGYLYVYLRGYGTRWPHQLVAAAFLGCAPEGTQVRHGERGKQCNSPDNLCYGTPKQNTGDSIEAGRHGSITLKSRTECPQGHQYTSQNTYKTPTGGKQCRKCRAVQAKITETKRDKAAIMRAKRAATRSNKEG